MSQPEPNVAIVHDWLNTKRGGAERVLLELAKLFPKAPIYPLLFEPTNFPELEPRRVHSSSLQRYPAALRHRARYLLPKIPKAIEQFNFDKFDIVISSSAAFSKNIVTRPGTIHLCYCHTPMRFAWDYWPAYLEEQRVGPIRRSYISRQVAKLRQWDYYGHARVDYWLANSQHVAKRIRKYYHQKATVIYPPVDTQLFASASVPESKRAHYLCMSALTPYKKLDVVIEAFRQRGDKLIILSDGPERKRLEESAPKNVIFKGYVSDEERAHLLGTSRGLVFPSEEDFGIAMVEATAAGTPVIAYAKGGASEIVVPNKTGVLFDAQTPQALNKSLDHAETLKFSHKLLLQHAQQFDVAVFDHKIATLVTKLSKANSNVSAN